MFCVYYKYLLRKPERFIYCVFVGEPFTVLTAYTKKSYNLLSFFLKMKFDSNLAAIHGYLCADGYVIRNPKIQKKKYYQIGLRNTNYGLLKDFQDKFFAHFGVKPKIRLGERCNIGSKDLYFLLTKNYSYYCYEWNLPKLSKKFLKYWLRAFFDCESWVECQKAKSRLIGLECANKKGIIDVQKALLKFDIKSRLKKRSNREIYRLGIFGLNNLKRFQKYIGFLHVEKSKLLQEAIDSYVYHYWEIPLEKKKLAEFIQLKGRKKHDRNDIGFYSIKLCNLIKLKNILKTYGVDSRISGSQVNNHGSVNYSLMVNNICLTEGLGSKVYNREKGF